MVDPNGVITGDGSAFAVTVKEGETAIQPLAEVTVTSNTPEDVTVIDWVVCELFHR